MCREARGARVCVCVCGEVSLALCAFRRASRAAELRLERRGGWTRRRGAERLRDAAVCDSTDVRADGG